MIKDINNYSYDEWLDFVFWHRKDTAYWYMEDQWKYKCNSSIAIDYLTRLFLTSEELTGKYGYDYSDIEQGLWFLTSYYGFMKYLLDDKVEKRKREICIRSISVLYRDLFVCYNEVTIGYMFFSNIFLYCSLGKKTINDDIFVKKIFNSVIDLLREKGYSLAE